MSPVQRLGPDALASLAAGVIVPSYPRDDMRARIVHLGVGAFHRAHQAWYFDRLMQAGHADWMIIGASLRSPDVAAQLNPQAGLYTVLERDGSAKRAMICGAIRQVLVAPDNPRALIDAMAAPDTCLITLTITEKGYCLEPSSGQLNLAHPSIEADLANPEAPQSAPGLIVAALAKRRQAGLQGLTILSCDNQPHNGARTRDMVLGFARQSSADLAAWIDHHVTFPSSMVDRIVPATLPADLDATPDLIGAFDQALVKSEPFSQWVIEDKFATLRPPLDLVGVQFTDTVAGWENAKLRLLNGAHSALAYLGALSGHTFVHEALAAPGFRSFVHALWDESATTLDLIPGFDRKAYCAQLESRFDNAALEHKLRQIAMDGSQKLPQRLLAPLRDRLKAHQPSPALILAIAAWMRWQWGRDETGTPYTVDDPLAARTQAALAPTQFEPDAVVKALLGLTEIFGSDLITNAPLIAQLSLALNGLVRDGAAATIAQFSRAQTLSKAV